MGHLSRFLFEMRSPSRTRCKERNHRACGTARKTTEFIRSIGSIGCVNHCEDVWTSREAVGTARRCRIDYKSEIILIRYSSGKACSRDRDGKSGNAQPRYGGSGRIAEAVPLTLVFPGDIYYFVPEDQFHLGLFSLNTSQTHEPTSPARTAPFAPQSTRRAPRLPPTMVVLACRAADAAGDGYVYPDH